MVKPKTTNWSDKSAMQYFLHPRLLSSGIFSIILLTCLFLRIPKTTGVSCMSIGILKSNKKIHRLLIDLFFPIWNLKITYAINLIFIEATVKINKTLNVHKQNKQLSLPDAYILNVELSSSSIRGPLDYLVTPTWAKFLKLIINSTVSNIPLHSLSNSIP